jgi:hypothetical protein
MKLTIRLAQPADMNFVAASWFTSYWKNTARAEGIEQPVYTRGMNQLIDGLLQRSDVIVAVLDEVPDEILGYAVVEDGACHWVYVKSVYRRRGIATGLLRSTARRFSLQTSQGKKLAAKLGLAYDPFSLHPPPAEEAT